ncbi:MAG: CPBP family intramembrane metalloprotease [Myxococcales bacterium]
MSPARALIWLRESFEAIEHGARAERATASSTTQGIDPGPWVACVVGALALVIMEYVGVPATLSRVLSLYEARVPGTLWGSEGLYASRWMPLLDLSWWIGWRLIGFFVLPALAVRLLLRRPVHEFGLALHSLREALPIYGGLYLLLLPVILLAAIRPEFSSYYPFYKRAGESWFDLLAWELMYAAHFVALEFFFRGFWLESSRRALGVYAIAFMVVPYCMIHFTKPLLEVVAAIPAGVVLGLLAMRTRSIWGGAALHVAVAFTMDAVALLGGAGLPSRWWP